MTFSQCPWPRESTHGFQHPQCCTLCTLYLTLPVQNLNLTLLEEGLSQTISTTGYGLYQSAMAFRFRPQLNIHSTHSKSLYE